MADLKDAIRREIRAARRALGAADRRREESDVLAALAALPELARARRVMVYAAFRHELDLGAVARRWIAEGRTVAVPALDGPTLVPRRVHDWDDLVPGPLGIPASRGPSVTTLDAIVVPGVAFDRRCGRLGYGAGFYDRFLGAHPGVFTVGVAFTCQIVPAIPREPHDVDLQALVVPGAVIRSPSR